MTTDLTPETATERVELAALLRDFDGGPAVITAPYFEYVDEHLRPAVERMIASRLADMTRQRNEAQRDLTKTQDAFHLAKKSRAFQKKKRDQAERELADLRARLEALPLHCYTFSGITCLEVVDGTFPGGAQFTLDHACLPCQVRAALSPTDPPCSTCAGSGRVDWAPGQQRDSEEDQQPCPDCVRPTDPTKENDRD